MGADPSVGLGQGKTVLQYIVALINQRVQQWRYSLSCHGLSGRGRVLVRLLSTADAWHRRRHALLGIRGRYAAPTPAAASGGDGMASGNNSGGSGSAASSSSSSSA